MREFKEPLGQPDPPEQLALPGRRAPQVPLALRAQPERPEPRARPVLPALRALQETRALAGLRGHHRALPAPQGLPADRQDLRELQALLATPDLQVGQRVRRDQLALLERQDRQGLRDQQDLVRQGLPDQAVPQGRLEPLERPGLPAPLGPAVRLGLRVRQASREMPEPPVTLDRRATPAQPGQLAQQARAAQPDQAGRQGRLALSSTLSWC
jgi:hypothetical protein